MRPALQRLLNRPGALFLLDHLIRDRCTAGSFQLIRVRARWSARSCRVQPARAGRSNLARGIRCPSRRALRVDLVNGFKPFSTSYSRDSKSTPISKQRIMDLSEEHLLFESDVGHENDFGTRLVDRPEHREDFALWIRLLEYQRKHRGSDGMLDIWRGMMLRCGDIELPVTGEHADQLWTAFVELGINDPGFLETLYRYAQWLWVEKRKRWPGLYSAIVGHLLEKMPEESWKWHVLLRDIHLQESSDVKLVFPFSSSHPQSERQFKNIYYDVRSPKIYGQVIPRLCQENKHDAALRWHKVFALKKDLPQTLEQIQPLIRHLHDNGEDSYIEELTRDLATAGIFFDPTILSSVPPLNSTGRVAKGSIPGLDDKQVPRTISDEFCARMFATGSFSFTFVLIGLQLLGVTSIGPISVREISIRASDPEDLERRFKHLKEANIDVGRSMFVRLVQKVAQTRDWPLLQDILRSDQHPDVLTDWPAQERLLAQYQRDGDVRNFHRTMAILTLDFDSREAVHNIFLRSALRNGDMALVSKTVEDMQEKRITVTETTIKWMYFTLLRNRKPHRADADIYPRRDDIGRLISLWQSLIYAGLAPVRAYHWRDIIKRLGMSGRWDTLQVLLLWIAEEYAPITPASEDRNDSLTTPLLPVFYRPPLSTVPFDKRSEFHNIFSRDLQRAIVEWAFIHPYRNWYLQPTQLESQDTDSPPEPDGIAKLPESPSSPEIPQFFLSPEIPDLPILYPRPSPKTSFSFLTPRSPKLDRKPLMPWTRGLILLQHLSRHGLALNTPGIRAACRHQLRYLFGRLHPGMPDWDKRQRARERNPWTVKQFVDDAEKVWPGLFANVKVGQGRRTASSPADGTQFRDVAWEDALVNPVSGYRYRKWLKDAEIGARRRT